MPVIQLRALLWSRVMCQRVWEFYCLARHYSITCVARCINVSALLFCASVRPIEMPRRSLRCLWTGFAVFGGKISISEPMQNRFSLEIMDRNRRSHDLVVAQSPQQVAACCILWGYDTLRAKSSPAPFLCRPPRVLPKACGRDRQLHMRMLLHHVMSFRVQCNFEGIFSQFVDAQKIYIQFWVIRDSWPEFVLLPIFFFILICLGSQQCAFKTL